MIDSLNRRLFRMFRAAGPYVLALTLAGHALAGPKEDFDDGELRYATGDMAGSMASFKRAADAGFAPAQARLGEIMDRAEMDEEAVEYFRKAAEQGDSDGELGLGGMYGAGEGVKQDFAEAVKWATRAANRGNVRAIHVLASAYIRGDWGLDEKGRNNEEAVKWIRKAVEADNFPAMEALAKAYRSGDFGLTPDAAQAQALEDKVKKLRGDAPKDTQPRRRR